MRLYLFCRLEVRQVAEGVHHVPGLVEARVTNMNEAWEVLQTGSKARVVGSTNANEHSSRSHWLVPFPKDILFTYVIIYVLIDF
jgi:kinesin family protein C2/C3